jgi:hypothetical protein
MPNRNALEITREISPESPPDVILSKDEEATKTDSDLNKNDNERNSKIDIISGLLNRDTLKEKRLRVNRNRNLFLTFVIFPGILLIPTIHYFSNNKKFWSNFNEPNITSFKDKNEYLNQIKAYNKTLTDDIQSYHAIQGLLVALGVIGCIFCHCSYNIPLLHRKKRSNVEINASIEITSDDDNKEAIPENITKTCNKTSTESEEDIALSKNTPRSPKRPNTEATIISSSPAQVRLNI